jgi:glycosyltransferase involved in cell wall biosynthesis
VRDFLIQRWHVDEKKIGIVYHGIEQPPTVCETIKPSGIDRRNEFPIIFTAGSIRPARGLEDVIRAVALVRQRGVRLALLIAGEAGPASARYKEYLVRLTSRLGIESQVVWAGELEPLEMSWCFYHCAAYVMTSRVEACPNTALEAMSHGALCISADNPPMPELFGDAAVYYPSTLVEALADRLATSVLEISEGERETLRHAAARRARQFSWQRASDRTIDELLRCVMPEK